MTEAKTFENQNLLNLKELFSGQMVHIFGRFSSRSNHKKQKLATPNRRHNSVK